MITKPLFLALALVTCSATAWAQITLTGSQSVGAEINDNHLNGLASTISLGSGIQSITSVSLTLDIDQTANNDQPFNGDYYAYLTHGSTLVTLLGFVGANPGNPFGYSTEGMNVTLADGNPNIHTYESGAYTLNGSGQLTGTWSPDGGLFSSFNGQGSAGGWTLFIADESEGGIGDLNSWSLQVMGNSASTGGGGGNGVPDSNSTLELFAIAASSLALWSVRQRRLAAVPRR